MVIEGISAQSPQGRIYGDIFILCQVVEENYYIKKGEKKVASNFWEKISNFKMSICRLPENATIIFSVPLFHGEQAKLASL